MWRGGRAMTRDELPRDEEGTACGGCNPIQQGAAQLHLKKKRGSDSDELAASGAMFTS
jgi:hypothetical protein